MRAKKKSFDTSCDKKLTQADAKKDRATKKNQPLEPLIPPESREEWNYERRGAGEFFGSTEVSWVDSKAPPRRGNLNRKKVRGGTIAQDEKEAIRTRETGATERGGGRGSRSAL